MNIVNPRPFTFREGPRAILLLHGFTGSSADVRMLGRYLRKKGYTCHAPIYEGHGSTPEKLMETNPTQWWEDTLNAYQYLQFLGYHEIAVVGLSIGGALGLQLARLEDVKGIVFMCTPMYFEDEEQLTAGLQHFAQEHKQLQQKDEQTIQEETAQLIEQSSHTFKKIGNFIEEMNQQVQQIKIPSLVIQAEDDQIIDPNNAKFLFEQLSSEQKQIKWYKDAGHAITLGKKRDQVHQDVYQFLETLDWEK